MDQFKRGDFSTCFGPRPGRPKTVTTAEIIDQIHELILEDRRISAKLITATGHLKRAGWFHHSWKLGHAESLREEGPEMPDPSIATCCGPFLDHPWTNF